MRSYVNLDRLLKKYKEHKVRVMSNGDFTEEEIKNIKQNYIKQQNDDTEKRRKAAGTIKVWETIENRKRIRRVK